MTAPIPELDHAGLRRFGLTTGALIAGIFGLLLPWLFDARYPAWPWLAAALAAQLLALGSKETAVLVPLLLACAEASRGPLHGEKLRRRLHFLWFLLPVAAYAGLRLALEVVGKAFGRLRQGEAQVLHGDLHPWNVHVKGKRMIAFDFEDVMWGHRVQDVAITLFYERDQPGYADLRAAFTEGYSAIAVWPESYDGEVDHFMAARTLMFVNFILNIGSDVDEFYPAFFTRLESFLEAWG